MGTSPFIAAGQFGHRAMLYYRRFYGRPKVIAGVICRAYDVGVRGIQLLPYRFVVDAVKLAEDRLGARFAVIGTIARERDMEALRDLDVRALLLHGEVTDSRDEGRIGSLLDLIREAGAMAGLATHRPLSTLDWLSRGNLDVDVLMLPFNMMGYFMDGRPEEVIRAIRSLGKPVIAKKTLAAGTLDPEGALTYVADAGCVHAVAVGVASEEEAEETLAEAVRLFR